MAPDFKLVCGFRLGNISLMGEDGVEAGRCVGFTIHDDDAHDYESDVVPNDGAEFEMVFALPEQVAEALLDRLGKLMAMRSSVVRDE